MTMAYAATSAGSKLEKIDIDLGDMGPTDVLIDVDYCGICHSDLSMLNNEWGMSQYPLVAGHEVVGRVADMGESVSGLEVGQVVGLGWHSMGVLRIRSRLTCSPWWHCQKV